MSNTKINRLKGFDVIIKDDLSNFFVNNVKELTVPTMKDIDEVSMIDYNLRNDKDYQKTSYKDEITLLGDFQPADILSGVPIEKGTIEDLLGDDNFGAVDGSSGRITRHYLSVVFARSAFGSYSYSANLPMAEIIDNKVNYVIGWEAIVKSSPPHKASNIFRLSGKLPRYENVNTIATRNQSLLEIESIPKVVSKYKGVLDYLGVDGPLYQRSLLDIALKHINIAIKTGLRVFAIVKRSEDDAFYQFLRRKYINHPVLHSVLNSWFHSDREFFGCRLKVGHRSPFFLHINRQEKQLNIHSELRRVCTWVKLASGKVCRIELPYCQAGINQELEMADDLLSIIYKLSQENKGMLPLQFTRADKAAMIRKKETEKQAIIIDNYLKELGLASGDQDNWK